MNINPTNRRPPRLTDADIDCALKQSDHREDFPTYRITRYPDAVFDVDGMDAGAFNPGPVKVVPVAPWIDYAAAYQAMTDRALHQMRMF